VPIHEYPPAEIKKAIVGNGAATKEQVQFMLTRLLRLKAPPYPNDAADGVAVALACLRALPLERLRRAAAGAAWEGSRDVAPIRSSIRRDLP
jgi:crossover junction endodeoxyribonuclease RuvC